MSSNSGSMIVCKKCGTENKNGDSFCKECGGNLLEQNGNEALPLPQDHSTAECKKCGAENNNGDSFCRSCGGSLLEIKSIEKVSNENGNKKVLLSIIAVVVGVSMIAIVLKMSNNNDYTTEAAPAYEEAMPVEVYSEAMPITTNNFYELKRRVDEAVNNLVSSASEVEKMKAAVRDPIEAMGYDFDKTLLSVSTLNSIDEASLGFTMLFREVKLTVFNYPDESVAKGLVSEETKNIIVGARDAALQKSKEPIGQDVFIDAGTKLMWQDNSDAKTVQKDWKGAINYCQDLSLAGFNDWRLPKIDELESIVDDTQYDPAIKVGFENVASDFYWTSSSDAIDNSWAWIVTFEKGNDYSDSKDATHYLRCVRNNK